MPSLRGILWNGTFPRILHCSGAWTHSSGEGKVPRSNSYNRFHASGEVWESLSFFRRLSKAMRPSSSWMAIGTPPKPWYRDCTRERDGVRGTCVIGREAKAWLLSTSSYCPEIAELLEETDGEPIGRSL